MGLKGPGATMASLLRRRVIVGEGGRIEIPASDLPPGTCADVTVETETGPSRQPAPLSSFIGCCKGMFASRQEADDYLRGERDAWDR